MDMEKKFKWILKDVYVLYVIQDKFVFIKVLLGNGLVLVMLIEVMYYDEIFGMLGDDVYVLIICKLLVMILEL